MEQAPPAYPVLIIGREIMGTGSARYVSFRLSLPANLHHNAPTGELIDYVNTRYSFVEALRTTLLQEYPALELPMLDSKRLMGSLSSSVVNQRTRIINNFLRTCQESETIKSSRQWGEFLRGQKPGASASLTTRPTAADLRAESSTDAAPPMTLAENPAAIRGMSFGWLLENLSLFNDEQAASAPPEYAVEEGQPEPMTPVRESISNTVDADDEDDLENIQANPVAVPTPRQVMRAEFYRMVQESRGRATSTTNRNLFTGSTEELEAGESKFATFAHALPPLIFEFVGCFFFGLVVNFSRSGPAKALTSPYSNLTLTPVLYNYAFASASLMYALGHVSGGHMNPAVSLAIFFRRHLTFLQMIAYVSAQLLGFIVASVTSYEILDELLVPADLKTYDYDEYESFVLVTIFSFALCYCVLCTSTSAAQTGNSHFGMASSFVLAIGMVVLAITGTGSTLNSGLDFGLILTKWMYDSGWPSVEKFDDYAQFVDEKKPGRAMWYYIAGPAAGSLLAALVYRYIKVTAFTKRHTGCFNNVIKTIAPYLVEMFGTFLIAFTFLVFKPAPEAVAVDPVAGLNLQSTAYMMMTIGMVFGGGFISGGHYNPAVSLGVACQGKMGVPHFILYLLFQIAGAFGASTVLWQLFSVTAVPEVSGDHVEAGIMEGLFSMLLVFVVLNVTSKANQGNSFYGFAYGGVLQVAVNTIGTMTGGALNPAIALGAYLGRWTWNCDGCEGDINNFFDKNYWKGFDDSWCSIGVPLVGALVAAYVYKSCVIGGLTPKCASKPKSVDDGQDGMEMSRMSSLPNGDAVSADGSAPSAPAPESPRRGDRRTSL